MPDDTLKTLIPEPPAPESLVGKTVLGSLIGKTLAGSPAADAPGEQASSAMASGIELGPSIGEGGMGRIYRARQAALKRDVAVKMVREEYGDDPAVLHRFVAESVVTGALEHPNIVPVHDLARTPDRLRPYLAMKLVDGREWTEILEAREPSEWLSDGCLEEQLEILHAVGNAVAFAHSREVVHRDLKPQNIMVGAFGEVLVMDWGLALDISETPSEGSLLEHRSTVRGPAGTPAFMAPELAAGRGNAIGPWTDVYLLGGILHEIITGDPPHRGGSIAEVLLKASEASPPQFGPEVPHELASICARALAAAPEDRYTDVAALQGALKGFLKHRESERLCDAAEARLVPGASSAPGEPVRLGGLDTRYARLAEAVAGYRQAQVLWPQSKRAVRGEASARIAYAEDALARDDLGLAEAQLDAARAPGLALAGLGARSEELRELVTARRAAKARARRNAKLVGAGALVLLVATIVSLALGRYFVGKERDRVAEQKTIAEREAKEAKRQKGIADGERAIAQEQRRVAVAERDRAVKLVDFMLTDLKDRLGSVGRLDLLRAVAWQVQQYLSDQDTDETSAAALLRAAKAHLFVGDVMRIGGAPALPSVRRSIALVEKARALEPSSDEVAAQLELALTQLASELFDTNDADGALRTIDEAVAVARARVKRAPRDPLARWRLANVLDTEASLLSRVRRPKEAEERLREALTIVDEFVAEAPNAPSPLRVRAQILVKLGRHAHAERRSDEALELYNEAKDITAKLVDADPLNTRFGHDRAQLALAMATLHLDQNDIDAARRPLEAALQLFEGLATHDPDNALWWTELTMVYEQVGRMANTVRDFDQARLAMKRTLEITRELLRLDPRSPHLHRNRYIAATNLAELLRRRGALDEALAAFDQAGEALRVAKQLRIDDPGAADYRDAIRRGRADTLSLLDRHQEALPAYREEWSEVEALLRANSADALAQKRKIELAWRFMTGSKNGSGLDREAAVSFARQGLEAIERAKQLDDTPAVFRDRIPVTEAELRAFIEGP